MELNKLLSEMAVELADLDTREETVDTVVQYARTAVKADDAGVMLVHTRKDVETPAGTTTEVDVAHQLQAQLGEGPCLAAVEGDDEIYVVDDTISEERWPRWGKAAADLGYRSTVSASMRLASRRIGSLNVYSRSKNAFNDSDAEVVGLLASHATAAIAAAKRQHELNEALSSRTVIGQAQGILMHAFGIDAARAFAYMRRISQDENVKLLTIAETVVEDWRSIGDGTGH